MLLDCNFPTKYHHPKFLFEDRVRNSGLSHMSKLDVSDNSVAQNIISKSERVF